MVGAIVIFLVTYAVMITEKFDRAMLALAGASCMVLTGILDFDKALSQFIDWKTIVLIIGMMILVRITQKSGVFESIAWSLARYAKGEPRYLLVLLGFFTAVASAFLDNVTTVLLVVPVTLSLTKMLRISPIPFLLTEIITSNIGGTATLIGDPPNIMIGQNNAHLTFNSFLFHLGPIALLILCVIMGLLYFLYRKKLQVEPERRQEIMKLQPKDAIRNSKLLFRSLTILILTLLGFFSHTVTHIDPAVFAITGATILMLWTVEPHRRTEKILADIEWGTVFFFVGLFSLVGGLQEMGIIKDLARYALDFTGGDTALTASLLLWISGITSATIDNIPFVSTLIPLIKEIAGHLHISPSDPVFDRVWWSLALGACLGGNGSLIGASANVIVAQMAEREGHKVSYMKFLWIGLPVTVLSLLLAHIYLYLRYIL
ncbi:sodium:proton antiporter [Pasteuria penetrans]|uniref:sodium:proton antiporter n=1 Tax=Pasteuria penetrans TaxID=86005 RepID=UPI0011ECE4A4|nr:ArsB/NhaD family transporter [Pasteuria penetrans]